MPDKDLCRTCSSTKIQTILDLGNSPIANAYLESPDITLEPKFPLRLLFCRDCLLVQTSIAIDRSTIFQKDYAYFSSTSKSWLEHIQKFVERIYEKMNLDSSSFVLEIASNDGYLLQYCKDKGSRILGIEPTLDTAQSAINRGIPTIVDFFGLKLAENILHQNGYPDVVIGNNVLAHVPDLNDFIAGVAKLLAFDSVAFFEIPHLLPFVQEGSFDTAYHEHYSYFSLNALVILFERHNLVITDAEKLPTHGGSLRIKVRSANTKIGVSARVKNLLEEELKNGLVFGNGFEKLQNIAIKRKLEFSALLSSFLNNGKRVYAYGAAAKGNTFLNYCEINQGSILGVFDAATAKQGKYLPGTKIPILSPAEIPFLKPDVLLILPWNIREEIVRNFQFIREWGGVFMITFPEVGTF